MKNKRKNILDIIMVTLIIIGLIRTMIPQDEVVVDTIVSKEICREVEICETNNETYLNHWLGYTQERFKLYNKDIDTNTVKLFVRVATHYGFTKDSTQYRLIVGQILLESGANQRWYTGHPYEDELVISYAGAIGMTQILPSTAHHFMNKILSDEDVKTFKEFGGTDFSFAKAKEYSKREKIALAKAWLSNEDNNIIMWGYIMRYNMSKCGNNIIKSLIAYNAGRGGLNLFMKRGNSIWKHDYIKGIYNRLNRVERKLG